MKNFPSTYCFIGAGTSDFPSQGFICVWPLHKVAFCENQCKEFKRHQEESLQHTSFFPNKTEWSKKRMILLSDFLYIPILHSISAPRGWLWSLGPGVERPPKMFLGLASPHFFILCSSPQIAGSFHGTFYLNNHFLQGNGSGFVV